MNRRRIVTLVKRIYEMAEKRGLRIVESCIEDHPRVAILALNQPHLKQPLESTTTSVVVVPLPSPQFSSNSGHETIHEFCRACVARF